MQTEAREMSVGEELKLVMMSYHSSKKVTDKLINTQQCLVPLLTEEHIRQ